MDLLLTAAVFMGVFGAGLRGFGRLDLKWSAKRKMAGMANQQESDGLDSVSITREGTQSDGDMFRNLFGSKLIERTQRLMQQAGVYIRVSELLLIEFASFLVAAGVSKLIVRDHWVAVAAGVGALGLPIVYLRMRKTRRMKAFNQQLPHVLDLIKSSLEAGHSFQRALMVTVAEFSNPISGEFKIVIEQNRIGLPMGSAMDDLTERVPDEDLRLLAIAVKVQSDVGSSLAQIIGRLSEIVRIRQRLQLQVRAMTAQARLSGLIVGLLPAVVLLMFSLMKPGYITELTSDPTGLAILKTAIVLDGIAVVFIRSLLKVEY
ncbi:MAG: Type secretion system domain [Candidatus Binatus sp.]|nr:Type secretion system domain [Candidatus Binatus sp.]